MYRKGNELPSSVYRPCQQFIDINCIGSLLSLHCKRRYSKQATFYLRIVRGSGNVRSACTRLARRIVLENKMVLKSIGHCAPFRISGKSGLSGIGRPIFAHCLHPLDDEIQVLLS